MQNIKKISPELEIGALNLLVRYSYDASTKDVCHFFAEMFLKTPQHRFQMYFEIENTCLQQFQIQPRNFQISAHAKKLAGQGALQHHRPGTQISQLITQVIQS